MRFNPDKILTHSRLVKGSPKRSILVKLSLAMLKLMTIYAGAVLEKILGGCQVLSCRVRHVELKNDICV